MHLTFDYYLGHRLKKKKKKVFLVLVVKWTPTIDILSRIMALITNLQHFTNYYYYIILINNQIEYNH